MQLRWGSLLGQGARRHGWRPNLRIKTDSWPFLAGAPDSRLDFKRSRQEFEACTWMEAKRWGPELLLWTLLLIHLCTAEDQWRTCVLSQANSEHEGCSSDTVSSPLPSLSFGEAAKFYERPTSVKAECQKSGQQAAPPQQCVCLQYMLSRFTNSKSKIHIFCRMIHVLVLHCPWGKR